MGDHSDELHSLARAVHASCIQAAREGYQNAAISGLCGDGAQEAALSAIQMVDIESIIRSRNLQADKTDE